MDTFWRKCTPCKKPIAFNQKYWVCSVSTCNRVRTGLVFCSIECFDSHVPVMNHRDAGAFEKRSPTESQWKAEQASEVNPSSSAVEVKAVKPEKSVKGSEDSNIEEDILVVVSKVKAYIRSRSGMNTSDRVMNVLSESIRRMADDAIRSAVQHERKTVLDRDVR